MHRNQIWLVWLIRFQRFCPFLFALKMAKISFLTMGYTPWGQKIESAQKIHASRGRYEMHGNQILLGVASPVSEILVLYHLPSKQPKFPFGP